MRIGDQLNEAALKAGSLLQEAIELLDDSGAPADVAAHIEMAVSRINALLSRSSSDRQTD